MGGSPTFIGNNCGSMRSNLVFDLFRFDVLLSGLINVELEEGVVAFCFCGLRSGWARCCGLLMGTCFENELLER